jgi:GTP cyclohydrolase II
LSTGRDVARAIDALRRGWSVAIDGTAYLAIETADETALADFDQAARPTSSYPAIARPP